jgi:hypothetical protein
MSAMQFSSSFFAKPTTPKIDVLLLTPGGAFYKETISIADVCV